MAASCAADVSDSARDRNNGAPAATDHGAAAEKTVLCLAEGGGFLRARLTGSVQAELDWSNEGLDCIGATRPDGGVRLRFSHPFGGGKQKLVLVFGIANVKEGADARESPVNVTLIREGAGEFFGTRGDDKCTIDTLHQERLRDDNGHRHYRISASGFCTQPARAVTGKGSILITRFDFVGRVDYSQEDSTPDDRVVSTPTAPPHA